MICVPNRLVIEGMTALSSDHWSLVIGNEHGALSMRGRGRTLPEHPGQQGRGGEKGREKLGSPFPTGNSTVENTTFSFHPEASMGKGRKGTLTREERSGRDSGAAGSSGGA